MLNGMEKEFCFKRTLSTRAAVLAAATKQQLQQQLAGGGKQQKDDERKNEECKNDARAASRRLVGAV